MQFLESVTVCFVAVGMEIWRLCLSLPETFTKLPIPRCCLCSRSVVAGALDSWAFLSWFTFLPHVLLIHEGSELQKPCAIVQNIARFLVPIALFGGDHNVCKSCSVVSNALPYHGLKPTSLSRQEYWSG